MFQHRNTLDYHECTGQDKVDRDYYINKFARAGGGSWSTDATWSTTSGGAADTVAPTASDDVKLDANSGAVTIDSAAGSRSCRSIDCTGYTGTLTHATGITLFIGDATAGASNIALKFVAGMTYARSISANFNFQSTSATQQTITTGGKDLVTYTLQGAGSSYLLADANTASGTVTLTAGALDTNSQTCSWGFFGANNTNTKSLTLGTSTITLIGNNSSAWVLNVTGSTTSMASATLIFTGSGPISMGPGSSGRIYGNITRTGTASKTDSFNLSGDLTVANTFTVNGNSVTNRLLLQSSAIGTARTISAAVVSITNTDIQDITGAGAGSWDLSAITGRSGDCGGNSGITFTTSATQTATMSVTTNWSNVSWTSRVPLPQDNVLYSGVTGGTLNSDMPRLGRSHDWTGATGSPTWAFNNIPNTIFGSITLIAGMTISGGQALTLAGRSIYTLTSAGKQYTVNMSIIAPNGTYSLQDSFSTTGFFPQAVDGTMIGTFTSNSFAITCQKFTLSGSASNPRVANLGTSTITVTRTSSTLFSSNTAGLSGDQSNCTVLITGGSAGTVNFATDGGTWGTLTMIGPGITGELDVLGPNSFAKITFSDALNARSLKFTAGATITIRNENGFNVKGTSGKLMTVTSITGAAFTLTSPNRQAAPDYLSLTNCVVNSSPKWYAGANSVDNGGNTNWIFTAAPALPTAGGSHGAGALQSLMNLQNLRSF